MALTVEDLERILSNKMSQLRIEVAKDMQEMAADVKKGMEITAQQQKQQLQEELGNLRDIMEGAVQQLQERVGRVEENMDRHKKWQEAAEEERDSDREEFARMRNQVDFLLAENQAKSEKLVDIEDRSRRDIVRLIGLREGAEGNDLAAFLDSKWGKWVPAFGNRRFEYVRVHRQPTVRKADATKPRPILIRFLRHGDRCDVLRETRWADTRKNEGLSFYEDFSPATSEMRKAFAPVMRTAYKAGLKPSLRYQATLRLCNENGQFSYYKDHRAAETFVEAFVKAQERRRAPPGNVPGSTSGTKRKQPPPTPTKQQQPTKGRRMTNEVRRNLQLQPEEGDGMEEEETGGAAAAAESDLVALELPGGNERDPTLTD